MDGAPKSHEAIAPATTRIATPETFTCGTASARSTWRWRGVLMHGPPGATPMATFRAVAVQAAE